MCTRAVASEVCIIDKPNNMDKSSVLPEGPDEQGVGLAHAQSCASMQQHN
jgi:hypothetical protein